MGEGFTVECGELTAAAGRIDAVSGQVAGAGAPAAATAQAAGAANPGYLTSSALTEVTARFVESARELSGQLEGHGTNLRANARAYQDVEERNTGLFRPGG